MNKQSFIPMNLQLFAENPAGGDAPQTFEINGQQMTAEQIAESYKKLQGEFTKVTQKNSDLSKNEDAVKAWLEFDKSLSDLEQKTGQNLKAQLGGMMDGFIRTVSNGGTPTQGQMNQLSTQINQAEKKGDDETVARLKALEEQVFEAQLDKTLTGIEKEAQASGIEYDAEEFKKFADEWLDDLGIGDEFEPKILRKAYDAYEAKKLKEDKRKEIPPLGTSGGTSSPDKPKDNKVGGLKGAFERAMKKL